MGQPLSAIPATPFNLATAPVLAASAPVTTTVTLTAPTSAAVITGLTANIQAVPLVAQYVRVSVYLPSVTVSAAATITIGIYKGATASALTTLVQAITFLTATGGTTAGKNYDFIIPITATAATPVFPQAGSNTWLSAAATASTGNFVVNGAATTPASLLVEVL